MFKYWLYNIGLHKRKANGEWRVKYKQYPTAKRMQPGKDSTIELILQRETVKSIATIKTISPQGLPG